MGRESGGGGADCGGMRHPVSVRYVGSPAEWKAAWRRCSELQFTMRIWKRDWHLASMSGDDIRTILVGARIVGAVRDFKRSIKASGSGCTHLCAAAEADVLREATGQLAQYADLSYTSADLFASRNGFTKVGHGRYMAGGQAAVMVYEAAIPLDLLEDDSRHDGYDDTRQNRQEDQEC